MAHQKTKSDEFDFSKVAMDTSVLGDQTMGSLERYPQIPPTSENNMTTPTPYHNIQDTDSIVTGERPTDMAYIGDTDDVSTLANDTISERRIIKIFPSISIMKKGSDITHENGNRTNGSDHDKSNNTQRDSNDDEAPKGDLKHEPSFRELKYFIAAGFAIFLIGSIAALTVGLMNLKEKNEARANALSNEDLLGGDWDWTFKPTVAPSSHPTVTASPSFTPTTASPSSTPTTAGPTKTPTIAPTRRPSTSPSRSPTKNPTGMPSRSPSSAPSQNPTKNPTIVPSKSPSAAPSIHPSAQPTVAASVSPSGLPSSNPSSGPTNAPTTSQPSSMPSTSPPTMAPTTSPPTQMPSTSPTMTREETFRTYVGGASPNVLADIQQPGSVQKEVYDWLIADPNFYSYSEDRLVQRYALAVFSLKSSVNRRRLALQYSNECSWFPPQDGSNACNKEGLRDNIVLRDQNIDGTLPTELFMLRKLKTLVMPNSQVFGTLSDDIKGLKDLKVLDLSNNLMFGPLPEKIGDMKKLRILDLSNNSFGGQIPITIGKLKDMKQIILSGNIFTGTIPIDIRKLKELESLDLRSNRLSGSIPLEMMENLKLQQIQLTENLLTGVVETSFCQPLVNLAVFSTDCQAGGSIICNCCTACGNDATQASAMSDLAVTQSAAIEITEVAAPSLRGSANQSPQFAETSECETKVEVAKTCFESGNNIKVHFSNCDAQDNDWIGLYGSTADPQKLGQPLLWLEACGTQGCGHGSVYFDESAAVAAGSSWPIATGSYKAFLVSKGPVGESYKSLAESGEIIVQDSC